MQSQGTLRSKTYDYVYLPLAIFLGGMSLLLLWVMIILVHRAHQEANLQYAEAIYLNRHYGVTIADSGKLPNSMGSSKQHVRFTQSGKNRSCMVIMTNSKPAKAIILCNDAELAH